MDFRLAVHLISILAMLIMFFVSLTSQRLEFYQR